MELDTFNNNRSFTALINTYCREFYSWSRYMGVPKYDQPLADQLAKTSCTCHLRFDFSNYDVEIFIPLDYFSDAGEHRFHFPAFERCLQKQEIKTLTFDRFLQLAKQSLIDENESIDKRLLATSDELMPAFAVPKRLFAIKASANIGSFRHIVNSVDDVHATSLVVYCIKSFAAAKGMNDGWATLEWFRKYLELLGCNDLDRLLAIDVFYKPFTTSTLSERKDAGQAEHLPEKYIDEWMEETLVNHLLPLVAQIGKAGLMAEKTLIALIHSHYKNVAEVENNLLAKGIIHCRRFNIKGKLLGDTITYYRSVPNVLHEVFREDVLLNPRWPGPVYFKVFDNEQVTVAIRPFDIDRDLEMVHQWFNSEHAKTIWKMDWPLRELEHFYRTLLPEKWAHAYIGEINGTPTFNFEVYWATRDIVGDYFEVLPTDYGTHLFIAPTDKQKKYPSITTQSIVDWLFAQSKVGRLVGEGAVESMAALMNKIHVGFRLQGVIVMPHKKAHLNFCYREWYWEKFPQNRLIAHEREQIPTDVQLYDK
ncbi:GNAT family N-acetyltransferase [Olivibacter domesticus]|uniref:Acetyltransferase (GNAT) domain-containing protein n=1 Tax=Olivibacter domesticus TaxID=407022 RepID=A0A1H7MU00_OLID1|nr:GNAT family N-acetyltransferase [Olivibacter domesticus]SEL14278.1 Acetyltransferase (GNAT) domain-containing protein [Olivibacter domesticus]